MSDYRRLYIPGGSYFFTLVTHCRQPLLTGAALMHLRRAFVAAARRMPFRMHAIVVLPDHLHCLWSLPPGDADYARRWLFIKASFTRRLKRKDGVAAAPVWQPRYWEHWLRDADDFRRHLDYIHYNPVKHGLARSPAQWRWSSFRRYVERGIYPAGWGTTEPDVIRGMQLE